MRALSRLLILSTLATVLTFVTGVLGAPFLRVLRWSHGPWLYWPIGAVLTGLFWWIGGGLGSALLGAVWISLGVSAEMERIQRGFWLSSLSGLIAGTAFFAAMVWRMLEQAGIQNWERFVALTEEWMNKVHLWSPQTKLEPVIVAQQAPSAGVILLMVALAAGIIFEKKVFQWTGLSQLSRPTPLNLLEFRLPDVSIWIALTALLFTVVDFGAGRFSVVAANVTNLFVVLYFFQGLAVLESFLNFVKAGIFTRVVSYFVLVSQLFFVLSAVGLIDYWVDFRRRFDRMKMASENSQKM